MQSRDRLKARVLRAEYGCPGLEAVGARLGPPVSQGATGVERAPLIVEAVSQFVAYDGPYAAEVDRRIGVRIKVRCLEYRRREHDVAQRPVVGVDGLRGHIPAAFVDRPVAAAEQEGIFRRRGPKYVADQIIVTHDDRGIVA